MKIFFPRTIVNVLSVVFLSVLISGAAAAQSGASRPRRVLPNTPPPDATNDTNSTSDRNSDSSAQPRARTASAASPTNAGGNSSGAASVTRAYDLLQKRQYAQAESEALRVVRADAKNAEAWKIAGFAELNLEKYTDAANSLETALRLQRAEKKEDPNTVDALATVYVRSENFERALPLLIAATSRKGEPPNAAMLFSLAIAQYRTNRTADAEKTFASVVRSEPKNSAALFYLGRIAYERGDMSAAISSLNRATVNDPKLAEAWTLLAYAYLQRAGAAKQPNAADADNLSAVRAAENLVKIRNDEQSQLLLGRALISASQFARAATVLERAAASEQADATTVYLYGVAASRAQQMPKAIAALNRAAAKTNDSATLVGIYRELGYAYEVSKDYKNALAVYEKALKIAPDDANFKESAERVRPFAK